MDNYNRLLYSGSLVKKLIGECSIDKASLDKFTRDNKASVHNLIRTLTGESNGVDYLFSRKNALKIVSDLFPKNSIFHSFPSKITGEDIDDILVLGEHKSSGFLISGFKNKAVKPQKNKGFSGTPTIQIASSRKDIKPLLSSIKNTERESLNPRYSTNELITYLTDNNIVLSNASLSELHENKYIAMNVTAFAKSELDLKSLIDSINLYNEHFKSNRCEADTILGMALGYPEDIVRFFTVSRYYDPAIELIDAAAAYGTVSGLKDSGILANHASVTQAEIDTINEGGFILCPPKQTTDNFMSSQTLFSR